MTYTFKMREGVTWHDGTVSTAAQMAAHAEYTFERLMIFDRTGGPTWMILEPCLGVYHSELTAAYAQAVDNAVEDFTNATGSYLQFNLVMPYPPFLTILAQPWASILRSNWCVARGCFPGLDVTGYDPAVWGAWNDPVVSPLDDFPVGTGGKVMMGTGPYRFSFWTAGVQWRIVRFVGYWGGWPANLPGMGGAHPDYPGSGYAAGWINTVTVQFIPSFATRIMTFLAGGLDFCYVPRMHIRNIIANWQRDKIAISDPGINAFENGLIPEGRVPVPHTHTPPEPPYITHNDVALVSHDIYEVVLSPVPSGKWALKDYPGWSGLQRLVVVEYALITSPLGVGATADVQASSEFYWKEGYGDYAPSGMPDFDQRQDTWDDMCAPTAVANSLWWLDSKFEPDPTHPPPQVNDGFPLVTSYIVGIDDHDPVNVQPFIEHLAYLMDTNGQRTGLAHSGTYVSDRDAGLAQYLSWTGVNPQGDANGDGVVDAADQAIVQAAFGTSPGTPGWDVAADIYPVTTGWPDQLPADNVIDAFDAFLVADNWGETGMFYERTVQAPDFDYIKEEVERGQDVVLSLAYYYYYEPPGGEEAGEWLRKEPPDPWMDRWGHAVTVAGVNASDASKPVVEEYSPGTDCDKKSTNVGFGCHVFQL